MRAHFYLSALSITLGVALAQTPAPNPPPQQSAPSTSPTKPATAGTTPAEVKTITYKGVLVDLACSSGKSASAEAKPAQPSDPAKAPASDQSNSADRSTSDSGGNCSVSANSTKLGMKMDDGQTVRFDLVGNQRAQDALKNDKRWSKDLTENKPIHVKASGLLNGDKLVVTDIH